MYSWRERSPIRYPTPRRPEEGSSRSDCDIVKHSGSGRCRKGDALPPVAEYECRKSGGEKTEALTLRKFSDGLPSAGDLRNFLTTRRSPPKQKELGVVEHLVRDYRYPQTLHEVKMVRSKKGSDQAQLEAGLTSAFGGSESSAVATIGPNQAGNEVFHGTSVFQKRDIVAGDNDDQKRFKEYVKTRPKTGEDFDPCECGGKGVQVWMRLCGCGCRCVRCRAVIRYKRPGGDENDDEDDPLGWK